MTNIHQSHSDAQNVAQSPIQESLAQAIELVLTENRQVLEKVSYLPVAQLAQAIVDSKRIFVSGEGRSGLVLRMFAMRLMHLGCQDYVVGETITPSIQAGDLLIDCSGSGSTGNVVAITQKAKKVARKNHTIGEILLLSSSKGPNGSTIPEVRDIFPEHEIYDRSPNNLWDDPRSREAVEKTVTTKLIMAAISKGCEPRVSGALGLKHPNMGRHVKQWVANML